MRYDFLVETYETEGIKVLSVWSEFRDEDLPVRPRAGDPRGRSVREQMVHQCVSENLWFMNMLGIDVAAPPLPASGLPAQIELKGALRIDVTVGRPQPEWVLPVRFVSSAAPAFRAKAGRTVVLALANRGDIPAVFHLHGHHFRVLDRLDDGWKPFWLDTLAIDSGQTQRIAFAAEHSGHWLMEAMATDWAAPRFVRWYSIE